MIRRRPCLLTFGLMCLLGAVPLSHALPAPLSETSAQNCLELLNQIPRARDTKRLDPRLCTEAEALDSCKSVKGELIPHWDKHSARPAAKRILVFGGFHGDESAGTTLALRWMKRLLEIEPRNEWRFIPLYNPDGFRKKTRTNLNKVDLNRNFPTQDWDKSAIGWWKRKGKGHPEKFPGTGPASEPETKCAIAEIEEFKPDLVVSIHAPYGVLDFDGPRLNRKYPYKRLRWKPLGNFPGSLGRFLWKDRQVPVLTVELHGDMNAQDLMEYDALQDIIGTVSLAMDKTK